MDKGTKRDIRAARFFAITAALLGAGNLVLLLELVDMSKVGWPTKVMVACVAISYLALMALHEWEEYRIAKAEKESAKLEVESS